MNYVRLYSDAVGESHWQDKTVALAEKSFAPPAKKIEVSEPTAMRSAMFLRLRSGWDEPVHPSPVKQMLICLRGKVQVTASDGEFREIGPGDVWVMADLGGKGHHTRVISEDDFEAVVVQHA